MEINIFTSSKEAGVYKYSNNSINISAIFCYPEFLSSGLIWIKCFVLFCVNNRFHKKKKKKNIIILTWFFPVKMMVTACYNIRCIFEHLLLHLSSEDACLFYVPMDVRKWIQFIMVEVYVVSSTLL